MDDLESRIYGCLVGGLIGDAMGAPVEGRSYAQIVDTYGPDGVTDFEGVGTDDTAIREQLIQAILAGQGYVTCDEFAASFLLCWNQNYGKWWVPVRNMAHKIQSVVTLCLADLIRCRARQSVETARMLLADGGRAVAV